MLEIKRERVSIIMLMPKSKNMFTKTYTKVFILIVVLYSWIPTLSYAIDLCVNNNHGPYTGLTINGGTCSDQLYPISNLYHTEIVDCGGGYCGCADQITCYPSGTSYEIPVGPVGNNGCLRCAAGESIVACCKCSGTAPCIINVFKEANTIPTVTPIVKFGNKNNTVAFSAKDFINHFNDLDSNTLAKIKILNLPVVGKLKLSDVNVVANQEISVNNLDNLFFVSNTGWSGTIRFGWNGNDGTTYATDPAYADVTISDEGCQCYCKLGCGANENTSYTTTIYWVGCHPNTTSCMSGCLATPYLNSHACAPGTSSSWVWFFLDAQCVPPPGAVLTIATDPAEDIQQNTDSAENI